MYLFDDGEIELALEQLEYIKHLRCGPSTHSWRKIARFFTRKYPEFVAKYDLIQMADREDMIERFGDVLSQQELAEMTKWENGNQLLGIDLCTVAMRFFNETVEDGWN